MAEQEKAKSMLSSVSAKRWPAAAKTPVLNGSVKASKIDLGKLMTDAAITDPLEGGLYAQVQLKGRGSSVRALAASLDGQIRAVMGERRVKTTALDTLSADRPV